MSLRSSLAVSAAGMSRWGLRRVLKRNGGVLPGRIALAIDPDVVASYTDKLDASVVVTGTNGKTTTANLIADIMAASGARVVCNRAGNNMETGIAAALLEHNRKLNSTEARRVGVFECDELYTVRVLPKLKPSHFVLLNLFRDQLDRYGEIDHTQAVIAQALASSPATTLIFNADDPLCAAIASRVPNPTLPFGIEGATGTETTRISESRFCPQCGAPLSYHYVHYGQLGAYDCPTCGWARPALERLIEHVELGCGGYNFDLVRAVDARPAAANEVAGHAANPQRTAGTAARMPIPTAARAQSDHAPMHIKTRYNGLYMVYNIAAALFAATELGAAADVFQPTLDTYVPAGGRMASWEIAGRHVISNLAKNPVGFDRQIQQIKTAGGRLAAFFLNDNDADGHDVSWIWDVDFERIADTPGLVAFAGGTRAHDMQVRLKYAGIDAALVEGAADTLSRLAVGEPGDLYLVANYTAFPPLVKELETLQRDSLNRNNAAVTTDSSTDGVESARNGNKPSSPTAGHAAEKPSHTKTMGTGQGAGGPMSAPLLARPFTIVHLYPDALNLYGDGGNAIVLERRCAWRGIPVQVVDVTMGQTVDLSEADVVLMGGGADRDQLAVAHELIKQRDAIASYVEDGGTMLAICGSYQLLGHSYYMAEQCVEGLGVIDIRTVRGQGRLIGNVAVACDLAPTPFVGFENHGGRTQLGPNEQPLGRSVVPQTGNNGTDGYEGVLHKGLVGTYLHGPALSKNPELADWLITHALERRAKAGDVQAGALLPLSALDDTCEHAAHAAAMELLPR